MLMHQALRHDKALITKDSTFSSPNTLMIQGCSSDAGKSVMVAGLCRLLARQGKSVAPFKPQNMALNSAVTNDGGEIGRAQAVQAQACFLVPHTDMNPILLKPNSDTGAQVIVHGHPIDSMHAVDYHEYKKTALQAVLQSHQRLSKQYQTVIVEGAGSPAEINLRENDIANMGFAEEIDCPVILIADIDRGGVFAHLTGTLELLSPSEQDRIVGFIINRFRGDISLLKNGLTWLEQRCNKPVLGVIPYLENFFLDAEDAISTTQIADEKSDKLNIVVPVLNRISNHTDFDALRLHPDVNLQFVNPEQTCPPCDVVILPGSKNVISDLLQLKNNGWANYLQKHLRYGGKIIGVCGGYQMLGETIADPDAVESNLKSIDGFDLLNISTTLKPFKQLKQVSGSFLAKPFDNASIKGYEIHCGITQSFGKNAKPLIALDNGSHDGYLSADNNIFGTYLHGLFDNSASCNAILQWAGLKTTKAVNLNDIREQELERLADCLEENLNHDWLRAFNLLTSKEQTTLNTEAVLSGT